MNEEELMHRYAKEDELLLQHEALADQMDGMDPYTVMVAIADATGFADVVQLMDNSEWAWDLVQATQSNPQQTYELIRACARIDEQIAALWSEDDEVPLVAHLEDPSETVEWLRKFNEVTGYGE